MVTAEFARTMSAYNADMNDRIYAAAGRLPDAARRLDRGAFWHSIHGTLNHLIWADLTWMSRFDGWDRPNEGLEQSDTIYADFAQMVEARRNIDARLTAWTAGLTDAWLGQDLNWFSGAAQQTITAPRALLIVHLFNHQTHHRGQVHALLTAAGETTGATDLPLVLQFMRRHSE